MNPIRRLAIIGALLSFPASRLAAQIVERPVPFDSAGLVTVMTPFLAEKAALRPPWWPVSGDFTEARLFTANDSTYVLAVTRRTGVVERYSLNATDREAIRAVVSRLPRAIIVARNDARNAFVTKQTILGIIAYGPTFAGAISDNSAGATAGYLVVAGGTFFAASEIARRMSISHAQSDLAFNMGHNGALAGWAAMYAIGATNRAQSAGAFVGGLTGASLGVGIGRGMTEADAIGAAFGSDIGALIGWGTAETIRGKMTCTANPDPTLPPSCTRGLSRRAEATIILAAGIVGYPMGVLYPRNARYNVTPGDIQTLWGTTLLGMATSGALFLGKDPSDRAVAASLTAGGVVGIIAGDRFLVQRYDHSRTDGGRVFLGTLAGGLMGAGIATLTNTNNPDPHLVLGLASVGGLIGIIATERYLDPSPDAGQPRIRVTFNPAGFVGLATHTPGNHSLLNVRF
jgi:energy-converting hydrogenase Eha subunit C